MTDPLIVVQHHPLRERLLPQLLDRLDGAAVVVSDPAPSAARSPLRTYLHCLRSCPSDVTHLIVIQDDALPIPQFPEHARRWLEERPDDLVAFFVPGTAPFRNQMYQAVKDGKRWARLRSSWTPTVALAWPVELIPPMLRYCDRYDTERTRGDDSPVGRFLQSERRQAWATVPSLVEHPDVEESLIGRRAAAGQNRARVAAVPHEGLHPFD